MPFKVYFFLTMNNPRFSTYGAFKTSPLALPAAPVLSAWLSEFLESDEYADMCRLERLGQEGVLLLTVSIYEKGAELHDSYANLHVPHGADLNMRTLEELMERGFINFLRAHGYIPGSYTFDLRSRYLK